MAAKIPPSHGNRYSVRLDHAKGKVVVLNINGTDLPMTYDTANRLAVMLRGWGKIAKMNAGDLSVVPIGFSLLTDAIADELHIQKTRDATATFFKS